jgi:hypothetical protein
MLLNIADQAPPEILQEDCVALVQHHSLSRFLQILGCPDQLINMELFNGLGKPNS